MPVSPELAEGLARRTVDVYAELERALLALLADRLGRGLDSPAWVEQKLAGVREVLAAARALVEQARTDAAGEVRAAIAAAYDRGGSSALVDLARLGAAEQRPKLLDNRRAVDALAAETVDTLAPVHSRVLRAIEDAYRFVIASVAPRVAAGVDTRRQATQRALDRFALAGVRAFTDRAGRTWELATYAEMAVRTSTGRAAVAGHVDRIAARGLSLVYVSDAPQECELCRPWEGKVLVIGELAESDQLAALPAAGGTVDARNPVTGRTVSVDVAGTLESARLAGFQHPNCRHSVAAYLPGVTRLPTDTADPEGDADQQKLRRLERHVREWRRREAAAVDPAAQARAARFARAWQAAIRQHVATSSAKRQPERERIGNRTGQAERVAGERDLAAVGEQLAPDRDRSPAAPDRPDLGQLTDDQLAELLGDPAVADDPERLAEVLAELDRRDQAEPEPVEPEPAPVDLSAAMAKRWADQSDAEREALEAFYAGLHSTDREAADAGLTPAEAHPERRRQSSAEQERRSDFELWLHEQMLAAEDATRGNLLSPQGKRAGATVHDLFTGSAERSIRYASEELIKWWEADPSRRMGYVQWRAQATNSPSRQARRSRDVWVKALDRWEDVKRGRR